jgi:hypothetical protein
MWSASRLLLPQCYHGAVASPHQLGEHVWVLDAKFSYRGDPAAWQGNRHRPRRSVPLARRA